MSNHKFIWNFNESLKESKILGSKELVNSKSNPNEFCYSPKVTIFQCLEHPRPSLHRRFSNSHLENHGKLPLKLKLPIKKALKNQNNPESPIKFHIKIGKNRRTIKKVSHRKVRIQLEELLKRIKKYAR